MTRVADVMTRGVRTMAPTDSLQFAAQAMDELNVGSIPVCDGERLVGMVTDRDIAVRGVARGRPTDRAPLREVMSSQVHCCFEDQSLEEAAETMARAQIRRLPVLDQDKRLVGILALGDVAAKRHPGCAGDALRAISSPAQPDRRGISAASGDAGGGETEGGGGARGART